MTRRTVRLASVAALLVLALPLAACQNHQGVAAYVGDVRISESDVDTQVDAFFADKFWGKQVKQTERNEVRRRTMRAMVLREVVKKAASTEGVEVKPGDVKTLAQQYANEPQQVPEAFRGAPSPLLAEIFAAVTAIQGKLTASSQDQQAAATKFDAILKQALKDAPVELNPRYGKFTAEGYAIVPGGDVGVRDLPVSPPPLPTGAEGEQAPEPQS